MGAGGKEEQREREKVEKRELICIGCPKGCVISASLEGERVVELVGYTCPKGEAYARKELTHPVRYVTSTVRIYGGQAPLVSVRTEREIPKEKIFACMEEIRNVSVKAPVRIGERILEDIAETGVALIATKNVE